LERCAIAPLSALLGEGVQVGTAGTEFEEFVRAARPRLMRALAASRGLDRAEDGTAEALSFAWEHWDDVRAMANPVGYLYRVAVSRTRPRRTVVLPAAEAIGAADVDPGLIAALLALPTGQRAAVWLICGCAWSYAEAAEAIGISVSAVGNQLRRGLDRLRKELEVETHA
jgi:DNA-directed RNA polymerase specialized sigma24 family protein